MAELEVYTGYGGGVACLDIRRGGLGRRGRAGLEVRSPGDSSGSGTQRLNNRATEQEEGDSLDPNKGGGEGRRKETLQAEEDRAG